MAATNGKVRINLDDLSARKEIVINVQTLGNPDLQFDIVFDDMDAATDRTYGNIATDHNRRVTRMRDKDLQAALEFVFKKKFKYSTLDFNIYDDAGNVSEENGLLKALGDKVKKDLKSELDYFTLHPDGLRYLRASTNAYIGIVRVDASGKE